MCSSDNGVRVSGDVYITKVGTGSPCTLFYGIWDNNLEEYVARSSVQSCYSGRHPEIHAPKIAGHTHGQGPMAWPPVPARPAGRLVTSVR